MNKTNKAPAVKELILWSSDFQPFPSLGAHKLITKILWHTKKYGIFFADLTKIGMILIHLH